MSNNIHLKSPNFEPVQPLPLGGFDPLSQSSTPVTPQASSGSLIGTPRTPTPRTSITPRQAIDPLELALTQSNDLQHLFEKYLNQIDGQINIIKQDIDKHVDTITKTLLQRKQVLYQQVDAWKAQKLMEVNREVTNAVEYEDALLKAQKTCKSIMSDDKLGINQRKIEILQIKENIYDATQSNHQHYKQYKSAQSITKYINNITSLVDIKYQNQISMNNLSQYGQILNSANSCLSIPTIQLLKPIKCRQTKNGFKINLKWTVSQPLISDNFIIRCKQLKHAQNDMDDNDNKQNDDNLIGVGVSDLFSKIGVGVWKSLKFNIKKTNHNSTAFSALDIDTIFLYDTSYVFRIEYHITDPINLLIKSNEEEYINELRPPSSNEAMLIELEYHSNKGQSYEGHPRNLLIEGKSKKYRSKKNKDFDYEENDWIIFKVKHSGIARSYLPKAIVLRNDIGRAAVKTSIISICDNPNKKSDEWFKYDILEDINQGNELNKYLLNGVNWRILKNMNYQYIKVEFIKNYGEVRGEQCRFKVDEFRIYGLEFK